jgi:hypothetical protein
MGQGARRHRRASCTGNPSGLAASHAAPGADCVPWPRARHDGGRAAPNARGRLEQPCRAPRHGNARGPGQGRAPWTRAGTANLAGGTVRRTGRAGARAHRAEARPRRTMEGRTTRDACRQSVGRAPWALDRAPGRAAEPVPRAHQSSRRRRAERARRHRGWSRGGLGKEAT